MSLGPTYQITIFSSHEVYTSYVVEQESRQVIIMPFPPLLSITIKVTFSYNATTLYFYDVEFLRTPRILNLQSILDNSSPRQP